MPEASSLICVPTARCRDWGVLGARDGRALYTVRAWQGWHSISSKCRCALMLSQAGETPPCRSGRAWGCAAGQGAATAGASAPA